MIIGLDWMGWDGMEWDWIGLDGMGLLDIIFGWFFFFPTLMGPAARRGIPRRGVFFFFTSYCPKLSYLVNKSDFWTRFFEK